LFKEIFVLILDKHGTLNLEKMKCHFIGHFIIQLHVLNFCQRLGAYSEYVVRFRGTAAGIPGERADAGPCAGVVEDALAMP